MTWQDTMLCFGTVGLLLALLGTVSVVGRRYNWPGELQRKLIHVATGITALALPFVFAEPWPVLVLMGLAIIVMLLLRLPAVAERGIGSALHSVQRQSFGEIMLAAAVAILFMRSTDQPVLYVLPILILTISDAAAALAGVHYGRKTFQVERGIKSLEGSAIFFLISWLLALITLLLMSEVGRANVVLVSFVIALFATVVEAESWRGFDNLFVPVGVHLFLARYLDGSVVDLAWVALALGLVLIVCARLGPRIDLTEHAARASALLGFLILVASSVQNLLLPGVALAAHLYARTKRPCDSAFPDLDIIAGMAMISLFWLAFGEWHGLNAINLFNLTFAALALSLLATAGVTIVPAGLAAAALLTAAVIGVAELNEAAAQWHGPLWPWIAVAFVLSWSVPQLALGRFDEARSVRLGAVALCAPLILFISTLVSRT